MEAISVALTQPLRFQSSLYGTVSCKEHAASSRLGFPCRRRRPVRILAPIFRDQGHLDYYDAGKVNFIVCGGGIGKMDVDKKKIKKKKMKLLKGVSKDLLTLSQIGFEIESGVDHDAKRQIISEAAELLLEQLQKLKASESDSSSESSDGECVASANPETIVPTILSLPLCNPEMVSGIISKDQQNAKPLGEKEAGAYGNMSVVDCSGKYGKKKEEKMKSKASKKVTRAVTCESSSSSSESSDSECDEVVDLENLKLGRIQPNTEAQKAISPVIDATASTLALSGSKPMPFLPTLGTENKPKVENQEDYLTKIEVCMGGKCKKSGAGALLEEFQRVLGIDSEVTGCKCMGKCKEGPNVKVDAKSLCTGVGMEDVGVIVANFLGKNEDQVGLAA